MRARRQSPRGPRPAPAVRLAACLGALAALPIPGLADPGFSSADGPSVTVAPSAASQYVFRGRRLGGESLQPSVELDQGGLALGVWSSVPISGRVPGQSDPEIDPYGSWTVALSPSLSLAPGFTAYTYCRAPAGRGFYRFTFEPSLALSATAAGIRFTPKAYYDAILRGTTFELSAAYAIALKSLGTELDLSGFAGDYRIADAVNHAAQRVRLGGDYWQFGGSVPLAIGGRSRLVLGWAYAKGAGATRQAGSLPRTADPAAAGRGVASVSLSRSF